MKVFYIDFTFEKLRQYRIILSAVAALTGENIDIEKDL